jgi:hypothetical protein
MAIRYFRYRFEEALTPEGASRRASMAGGVLVRVDVSGHRTQITVATSHDAPTIEGLNTEPVEVSERDVLDAIRPP